MKVIESIINQGHGYLSASYLVIHETANPGATAENHVTYWKNNPDVPMTHYVADWTGNVYHTVPDDRICWHVGNANYCTIGIELCHARTLPEFERVWSTGVEFAAWYLGKRGWGIDRLLSHNDCRLRFGGTDHTDPLSYFREFGRSWRQFEAQVRERMEDDMPSLDEIWGYEINGKSAKERLYLCNVKDYESEDKSGRGKDCDDHTRLCYMAAKQETMQDNIDDMRRIQADMNSKLDAILKALK